jgi:pyruvate dehydrogenase E1 component alpha subunit
VGDINREYYRSKQEEADWKENRDPIIRFRGWLVEQGHATEDEIEAMNKQIKEEAKEAVAYAEAAPYPDTSEVDMHVYAETDPATLRVGG